MNKNKLFSNMKVLTEPTEPFSCYFHNTIFATLNSKVASVHEDTFVKLQGFAYPIFMLKKTC